VNAETINRFWCVWRAEGGSPPTKRHHSYEEAVQEAERLARSTGVKMYVLATVGYAQPIQQPVEFRNI
jgi:hypothetical protein